MNRIWGAISISRPLNCLITFVAVWAGAIIANNIYFSWKIVFAAFSASLIAAFGNIVNDISDIAIDRINKPYRPLVEGSLSLGNAKILSIIFAVTAIILASKVGVTALIVAFAVIILLLAYTPIFKRISFAGNVLIAFITSLAFIYGGIAVGKPFGAIIIAIFAFLHHFGREIVKNIQDRAADDANGIKTCATGNNLMLARRIAQIIFAILIFATLLPFVFGIYNFGYLITVLIGVDSILIFAIHTISSTADEEAMRNLAGWLKAAMPFGILAVYLGSRGY